MRNKKLDIQTFSKVAAERKALRKGTFRHQNKRYIQTTAYLEGLEANKTL